MSTSMAEIDTTFYSTRYRCSNIGVASKCECVGRCVHQCGGASLRETFTFQKCPFERFGTHRPTAHSLAAVSHNLNSRGSRERAAVRCGSRREIIRSLYC